MGDKLRYNYNYDNQYCLFGRLTFLVKILYDFIQPIKYNKIAQSFLVEK